MFIYCLFWNGYEVIVYCRCLSTACSGMVMRSLCTAGVYLLPVLEWLWGHCVLQVFIYCLFWNGYEVIVYCRCLSTACSGRARIGHGESKWRTSRKRFLHTLRVASANVWSCVLISNAQVILVMGKGQKKASVCVCVCVCVYMPASVCVCACVRACTCVYVQLRISRYPSWEESK